MLTLPLLLFLPALLFAALIAAPLIPAALIRATLIIAALLLATLTLAAIFLTAFPSGTFFRPFIYEGIFFFFPRHTMLSDPTIFSFESCDIYFIA
jgi:hypothetical protein